MKKFFGVFSNSWFLLVLWFVYILSYLSSLVRFYYIQNPNSMFLLFGKTVNLFWHSSPILIGIFVGYLFFYGLNFIQGHINEDKKIPVYILGYSSIFAFLISNYLLIVELYHYNNYLYSQYGITKNATFDLSSISLVVLSAFFGFIHFRRKQITKIKRISKKKIFSLLFLILLFRYSYMSLIKISDYYWYAKFSYDHLFGNYAKIMELRNTPQNSYVVIPPQTLEWPDIGNAAIVRYFLFPRTIISSSFLIDQKRASEIGEMYFIGLYKDKTIWPVINEKERNINFEKFNLSYSKLEIENEKPDLRVYKITF